MIHINGVWTTHRLPAKSTQVLLCSILWLISVAILGVFYMVNCVTGFLCLHLLCIILRCHLLGMRASIYGIILLNRCRYHRVNSLIQVHNHFLSNGVCSRHLIIPYLQLLFVLKAHKRTVLPGRGLHRGGVEARYLVSTTSPIDIDMVMACPMVWVSKVTWQMDIMMFCQQEADLKALQNRMTGANPLIHSEMEN